MRYATLSLCLLVCFAFAPPAGAQAPVSATIESCEANLIDTCCYVFTLCVENVSFDTITQMQLILEEGQQCAQPVAPSGWKAVGNAPTIIGWAATGGVGIDPGEEICGFQFTSVIPVIGVQLTYFPTSGDPFVEQLTLECAEECGVPVEPESWGRIKSRYD